MQSLWLLNRYSYWAISLGSSNFLSIECCSNKLKSVNIERMRASSWAVRVHLGPMRKRISHLTLFFSSPSSYHKVIPW